MNTGHRYRYHFTGKIEANENFCELRNVFLTTKRMNVIFQVQKIEITTNVSHLPCSVEEIFRGLSETCFVMSESVY